MSARILVFPQKALVRTRALRLEKQRKEEKAKAVRTKASRLEKQRKEQKDSRSKALVRTELESKKEQQAQSVQERTKAEKRTAHAREAGSGTAKYLTTQFRSDLKAAGSEWRVFALQLWSALHPDPKALRPVRPVEDVWRYAEALLERIAVGKFRMLPAIAKVRRDRSREDRRKVSLKRRIEARRLADVTAMLARGEYPGLG